MKIIYIAHCIGAPTKEGIDANLADLRRIIRKINLEHKDITPFCPYYADVVSMDDNNLAERFRGIKNDRAILQSGIVDELWLTGPILSSGMMEERNIALIETIPIQDFIGQF